MGHSATSQYSGEESPPLKKARAGGGWGGIKVEGEDKGSLSAAGYPPALFFHDFKHLGFPV